jgi:hypothetical protein
MGGQKNQGDGDIRRDFPGGWPGDGHDAFSSAGRTSKEAEAFNYMRTLLNYRKNNTVLQTGKMIQFIPRDNVYVYFRVNNEKNVMVVINNAIDQRSIDVSRFEECLKGSRKAKDIITGMDVQLNDLKMDGKSVLVLEVN